MKITLFLLAMISFGFSSAGFTAPPSLPADIKEKVEEIRKCKRKVDIIKEEANTVQEELKIACDSGERDQATTILQEFEKKSKESLEDCAEMAKEVMSDESIQQLELLREVDQEQHICDVI